MRSYLPTPNHTRLQNAFAEANAVVWPKIDDWSELKNKANDGALFRSYHALGEKVFGEAINADGVRCSSCDDMNPFPPKTQIRLSDLEEKGARSSPISSDFRLSHEARTIVIGLLVLANGRAVVDANNPEQNKGRCHTCDAG
jgi:hypothetical protein